MQSMRHACVNLTRSSKKGWVMKAPKTLLAAALATIVSVGLTDAQGPAPLLPQPGWHIPPHPRTFAEFLTAGHDLVVVGTVRSATETRRGFVRMPALMNLPVTETTLSIEAVMFGSAPDQSIEMTLSDTGYNLLPGDRLLAWGSYIREDNWRLRGRARRIDGDKLSGRPNEPVFVGPSGRQDTLSFAAIQQALSNGPHPSTVYNGMRLIALARLRSSSRWCEDGAVYEIDSLGWVVGQSETVPHRLIFPARPGCSPSIFPGDSLLVPLPPGFVDAVLRLTHCPSALRVQDGFVPGLGVSLNQIDRALDSVGPVLHVRSVQRKED